MRTCGGCVLCCRLLPIAELNKGANVRCKHQRTGKGCAVYRQSGFPWSCRFWSCRWLVNDDTADLRRPDRSHYVVDMMPDFVTLAENGDGSGEAHNLEVVQVWVDPAHREAWRDPALLAYLERRAADGVAGIIRFNATDAIVVFAPALSADRQWHEKVSGMRGEAHSFEQVALALMGTRKKVT